MLLSNRGQSELSCVIYFLGFSRAWPYFSLAFVTLDLRFDPCFLLTFFTLHTYAIVVTVGDLCAP